MMNKRVFCCGVLFGVLITWILSFYLYYKITAHPQSTLIKDQFQYLHNNIFNDDSNEQEDDSDEQLHDNSIHHEIEGGKSYYFKDKFAKAKLRRKQNQKLIIELKPVTITQSPEYGIIKNAEDQFIRDDGYKNHAFNCLVSNNIGIFREIADTRHKL